MVALLCSVMHMILLFKLVHQNESFKALWTVCTETVFWTLNCLVPNEVILDDMGVNKLSAKVFLFLFLKWITPLKILWGTKNGIFNGKKKLVLGPLFLRVYKKNVDISRDNLVLEEFDEKCSSCLTWSDHFWWVSKYI